MKPVSGAAFGHSAQRLVADDQPFLPWRCPPVVAIDDLQVGAADTDRLGLDQDGPVVFVRFGHVGESDRASLAGYDSYGAHGFTVTNEVSKEAMERPGDASVSELGGHLGPPGWVGPERLSRPPGCVRLEPVHRARPRAGRDARRRSSLRWRW